MVPFGNEFAENEWSNAMTEAVIVATSRSPIGRANKGSLVDLRPDDMTAQIVTALMAKVPQVKADDVEDLILGIGQPAGEGGFNIARVAAILAGLDNVPGVTVNRYCSSSRGGSESLCIGRERHCAKPNL
jgi:acetyl-CoA C-acetyltransferase